MLLYTLSRLFQAALTLFLLSICVFLLARVLGDPVAFMLPFDARPEDIARIRAQLGLDEPLLQQYVTYMASVLRGDLGVSTRQETAVMTLIIGRCVASFELAGSALVWGFAVSLLLGVFAAVYRESMLDRTTRALAVIAQAAPPFWTGIMLIQVFSLKLRLLPSAGMGDLSHLILPSFTIGLFGVAGMTRLVRSSMLDVLDSEFVKRARVTGISERVVIWKHALRNAILPMFTFTGEYFGILIAAGVVVETVFAWPGLGRLAYEAVYTRDYPLIQGLILSMAAIVLIINLAVDLVYSVIDPRIRYE